MFGVDWSNPETFWLNVTNLGLGLFVVLCLALIAIAACSDMIATLRRVRRQNRIYCAWQHCVITLRTAAHRESRQGIRSPDKIYQIGQECDCLRTAHWPEIIRVPAGVTVRLMHDCDDGLVQFQLGFLLLEVTKDVWDRIAQPLTKALSV